MAVLDAEVNHGAGDLWPRGRTGPRSWASAPADARPGKPTHNAGRADASAGPSGAVKELAAGICSGLGGTRVQAGSRQLMGPSSRRRVGVDSGIRRVEGGGTVPSASAPALAHHGTTPVIPNPPADRSSRPRSARG